MMKTNTFWIIFSIVSVELAATRETPDSPRNVSYEGAQVWRTQLRSSGDMEVFKKLVKNYDISLWSLNSARADYLIHDKQRTKVYRELRVRDLNHTVIIMNVQHRIEATANKPAEWTDDSLRIGHRMDWKSYPTIKIINEYFGFLKENYPSVCKIKTIGKSEENRPIQMIVISNGNPKNKAIVMTAGMHAREWIGVTSALYVAHTIITKFDQQHDYIKNKNWYIIPVVNPDGYEFTHTDDRLWRKNRRSLKNTRCEGVDINRNFAHSWKVAGVSVKDECQEDYVGPHAFSEPESQAVKSVLDSLKTRTPEAYIDLHSYGQYILHPWSASFNQPSNINRLKAAANGMKEILYRVGHRKFQVGTAGGLLYFASGVAIDWFYHKGVPLSFAVECRDTGLHGFLLPPEEIESQGKEIFAMIGYLSKSISPGVTMRNNVENRWF